jgi:HEPN superfamily protein
MTMVSTLTAVGANGPARAGLAGPGLADTELVSTAAVRDDVLPGMEASGEVIGPQRVPATVLSLLDQARRGLAEACTEADPGTRYICAHLAALRAAAAIVAARGEPGTGSRRRRPRSVWELLPQAEPTLSEWAAFFAASAAKRAAAEAGLPRAASAREAEDLIRDARTFLSVAERALGIDGQGRYPLRPAS